MAVNTAERRSSSISVGLPFRVGVLPDGSDLDASDRLNNTFLYAGIAAGGVAPPTTVDAVGTTDGGPQANTPGFVDFDGQHWIKGYPDVDREYFRLDNPGADEAGVDEIGELRIEWRGKQGLIGGRFGVHLGSDAPGSTPNYLGEIEYRQRGNTRRPSFSLPILGRGPVQYDKFLVPYAVLAEHDGSDFFHVYFEPRDHAPQMIVTGLQLTFDT